MKAAIYSPYLDTLGGGERYVMSFARILGENGWSVDLQAANTTILKKIENRFGFKLSGVKVVSSINRGSGYDLCFWLSDGSIPALLARKNILHFQRPFFKVEGKSLFNRMKFFRISKVVVNSLFTKKWIDKEFPIKSEVLYPPVDVGRFKAGKKEKVILNVSRFSQLEQSKRQDVLVGTFKKLFDSGNTDWQLILAGGSEIGANEYVEKLKKTAEGYPIKIIENPSFEEIKALYSFSTIFWSASGYGVNEKKEPNRVEHFGITTVEAMSSKCIPLVFDAGGHKESVKEAENGFLWKKVPELISKTTSIIKDVNLQKKIAKNAERDSKNFSYENFANKVLQIVK